jgi:hypothetical protein
MKIGHVEVRDPLNVVPSSTSVRFSVAEPTRGFFASLMNQSSAV